MPPLKPMKISGRGPISWICHSGMPLVIEVALASLTFPLEIPPSGPVSSYLELTGIPLLSRTREANLPASPSLSTVLMIQPSGPLTA